MSSTRRSLPVDGNRCRASREGLLRDDEHRRRRDRGAPCEEGSRRRRIECSTISETGKARRSGQGPPPLGAGTQADKTVVGFVEDSDAATATSATTRHLDAPAQAAGPNITALRGEFR